MDHAVLVTVTRPTVGHRDRFFHQSCPQTAFCLRAFTGMQTPTMTMSFGGA